MVVEPHHPPLVLTARRVVATERPPPLALRLPGMEHRPPPANQQVGTGRPRPLLMVRRRRVASRRQPLPLLMGAALALPTSIRTLRPPPALQR